MAKTAFVTGNRGFIGRYITRALIARGYRVLGVDKNAVDDAQHCFQRLTDKFDLVVHCAYVVGGRAMIDGTNTALIENVLLDSMLFDWALKTKQRRVLYFSSSAAYPRNLQQEWIWDGSEYGRKPQPLREGEIDLLEPYGNFIPDANYGWAKLNGEQLARVYAENGGRVHVVRPFSGYAEDQSLDYPFPSIIRRAIEGDLTVWGPPGQTRDWIHVSDVIEGALQVVEQDVREPINLCTGIGTEMGELMMVARHSYEEMTNSVRPMGKIVYLTDKPTGVFYRVGDPTKLNEIYKPKITIEEGVQRAIQRIAA